MVSIIEPYGGDGMVEAFRFFAILLFRETYVLFVFTRLFKRKGDSFT